MKKQERRELLEIAKIAAQMAGTVIKNSRRKTITHKGIVDLVTETDLASEEAICQFLLDKTPHIPILAEESGGAKGTRRWIIDPLDGTTNFAHGFPHYAVSIGLEWDGICTVGVIYAPCSDELFSGAEGLGATCNGVPIHTSTINVLNNALLGTGFPYDRREDPNRYTKYVTELLQHAQGIRRAGSAAMDLAYIAAGRLDGFWEFGLKPWDMAAGKLLISEAGGIISDREGETHTWDSKMIVAGNPYIHSKLLEKLRSITS
jgi:myo-inositol-1(or 4)-monophosphatase